LLFHKPPGVTCTTDRKDKDNIIDFIKYEKRIFPIGRLDKPSSGLIIMTNDGDMVNRILRKENMHEKEYIVKVDRPMNKNFLNKMSKSIPMLGTRTIPAVVTRLSTQVFSIVLIQGLNRQIRRMVEYCGYKVVSLKRIRIMHLELGDLPSGKWRPITREEMKELDIRLRNDVK
jgi:23S rRNA pseudouridine2604 synthase